MSDKQSAASRSQESDAKADVENQSAENPTFKKVDPGWFEKVTKALGLQVTNQVKGDNSGPAKKTFVDEGYYTPSPTLSVSESFVGPGKTTLQTGTAEDPSTVQIGINSNGVPFVLPGIVITDEKGETDIVDPDDDEHKQLWDASRDKIARRMFFVRADQRGRHMEKTFYADLYPVSDNQLTLMSTP